MTAQSDIKIIDNFVPLLHQRRLASILSDQTQRWQYIKRSDRLHEAHQFKQTMSTVTNYDQFIQHLDPQQHSEWYTIIGRALEQHGYGNLAHWDRFRLVLGIPHPQLAPGTWGIPHVDYNYPHWTLIYYCVNSTAHTVLFNEFYQSSPDYRARTVAQLVPARQGRAVIFNGLRYHTVELGTQDVRLVLNCNFRHRE